MLATFPDPYPDEVLYSVWARTGQRLGYPRQRDLVVDLFGDHNTTASVTFSSHLHHVVARLPSGSPYTVDRLIWHHTLLPFYAPYLPPKRVTQLVADMAGAGGPVVQGRAGIRASTVPAPSWLRYCPACVAEGRNRYGECYWHRLHKVPGVAVCPSHLCWLEESTTPLALGHYAFVSAEQANLREQSAQSVLRSSHGRKLLDIATATEELLRHPYMRIPGPHILHAQIHALLRMRGFGSSGTRVHQRALASAFEEYYSSDLLIQLGCYTPAADKSTGGTEGYGGSLT